VVKGISRFAIIVAASVGLSGCAAVNDGSVFDGGFWSQSPIMGRADSANLGVAELSKGNYPLAEAHFNKALKRNPQDPYALLGLGIVYQNTGRPTQARAAYESVVAVRPPDSMQMIVMNKIDPRSIREIASVNLALLDSGDLTAQMASGESAPMTSRPKPVVSNPLRPSQPTASSMMPQNNMAQASGPMASAYTPGERNIVNRFEALRALLDQDLITPEEYNVRRARNIGALLPLTQKRAAAGLDRPLPPTEQIVARLRAIKRALEMRAITITQHSAERNMILDALMPSNPTVLASPKGRPEGLMAAADSVRRLESMRASGLINSEEYAKERAAIEQGLQPVTPKSSAMAAPNSGAMTKPTALSAGGGMAGGVGVHLASFKSRANANKGWAQLQRAHRSLLSGLKPTIKRVNLGRRKGTFYRLIAGPVASQGAASTLCRRLKARRQFCKPTEL